MTEQNKNITIQDILMEVIENHPIADGLCNVDIECGCGIALGLMPCDTPNRDCCLAKHRILGDDEWLYGCGPDDLVYEAID